MGVAGNGYDEAKKTAWCELEATASITHNAENASFTLRLPAGVNYQNNKMTIISANRSFTNTMNRNPDGSYDCRVSAEYTGGFPFGGARSWIDARFELIGE